MRLCRRIPIFLEPDAESENRCCKPKCDCVGVVDSARFHVEERVYALALGEQPEPEENVSQTDKELKNCECRDANGSSFESWWILSLRDREPRF
jgi:hypothetical protein